MKIKKDPARNVPVGVTTLMKGPEEPMQSLRHFLCVGEWLTDIWYSDGVSDFYKLDAEDEWKKVDVKLEHKGIKLQPYKPKAYWLKPRFCMAIQFDGSRECALAILEWIGEDNVINLQGDERFRDDPLFGNCLLTKNWQLDPTDWIIRMNEDTFFEKFTNNLFKKTFE